MLIIVLLCDSDRYLVQQGVGSGTGLRPAIDFRIIYAHRRITIAGIVSRPKYVKEALKLLSRQQDLVPFEVQHGTTNVTIPMTMTVTKGVVSSNPGTPLEAEQGTMSVKVPYMCLAFVIEEKVLWMTDTNHIPERAWNVIHYGLDALDIGPAPDQVERSLLLAFVDLADLFMIGRASQTYLLDGDESHAVSR